MVDLIENALRAGVAFGLTPQIQRRIAGIAELKPVVEPAQNPAVEPAVESVADQVSEYDRLVLASGISLLSSLAKQRRTEPARDQILALRAVLTRLFRGTP